MLPACAQRRQAPQGVRRRFKPAPPPAPLAGGAAAAGGGAHHARACARARRAGCSPPLVLLQCKETAFLQVDSCAYPLFFCSQPRSFDCANGNVAWRACVRVGGACGGASSKRPQSHHYAAQRRLGLVQLGPSQQPFGGGHAQPGRPRSPRCYPLAALRLQLLLAFALRLADRSQPHSRERPELARHAAQQSRPDERAAGHPGEYDRPRDKTRQRRLRDARVREVQRWDGAARANARQPRVPARARLLRLRCVLPVRNT